MEKSTSCSNVQLMYGVQDTNASGLGSSPDDTETTKATFRRTPLNKRVFDAFTANDDSPGSSPNQSSSGFFGGVAKSSSFNKFKDAFETGKVFVNDDDDEYTSSDNANDVVRTTTTSEARMEIEAELDEIRSCPRLQRMFNISRPVNRPSPLSKSSSSSAVPENLGLDGKTMIGVSQARSQIQNMFESSAPKITFGQKLSEQTSESPKQSRAPTKKSSASEVEERKWVFDAINKYFDVIVEDEKAENDEEEEDDDDDMEDDSDDFQDEEECSPVFSSEVRCTSSRFTYENNQSNDSQYNLVRAEPVNIQEIDADNDDQYDDANDSYDDDDEDGDEYERLRDEEEESDEETNGEYDDREQGLSQPGFNRLQKSASSSKIRGRFQSLLMKSASGTFEGNNNLNNFKSNLRMHLQRRGSSTFSTGGDVGPIGCSRGYLVDEPSDDDDDQEDFSSEEGLQYDNAEDAVVEETDKYYKIPL